MPKVSKRRSTASRSTPLKKVDGNAQKKSPAAAASATSDKSKASKATPKSKPQKSVASEKTQASKTTTKTKAATSQKASPPEKNSTPNYLLLSRLRATSNPTISRLLSVPSTLKFDKLHEIMQIAFGWANCHMHEFRVEEVPDTVDERAHRPFPNTIMTIMRRLGDDILSSNDDAHPTKASDEISLADVFEGEQYAGKVQLTYEYDMGGGWEHDIVFLGQESSSLRRAMMIPADFPAVCLGGEGHPCAEDCGSIPGWEGLKELFVKPRMKDPEGLKEWYKTVCSNGDPKGLDPYKWDLFDVNDQLAKLAESPGFWS